MLTLAGCATAPPPLPPDTTSVDAPSHLALSDFDPADAALSCSQIAGEEKAITTNLEAANAAIAANRQSNEALGFVAAVGFAPLWLATDNNSPEKEAYQKSYARRDKLREIANLKGCNSGGIPNGGG